MSEPDKPTPTLFEWAGGEPAIRRLMDSFYDRVERDDLLGPRFFPDGVGEDHRAHVTVWWSEVFGGPTRYTEQLGGYEGMLAHHRGLAIAFGGARLLTMIFRREPGYLDNPVRQNLWRAGHAHAGVLLILTLVGLLLVDQADLSSGLR